MVEKNIWKSLKKWLGAGLVAGSLLIPRVAEGWDDLKIDCYGNTDVGVAGSITHQDHTSDSEEGTDGNDLRWADAPNSPYSQQLIFYTSPYNEELKNDYRPENSQTIFNGKIRVRDDLGSGVTVTNKLKFTFIEEDATRHYTAKIHCDGAWTPSTTDFDTNVNIRAVIANDGGYVNLPGIVNCPSGTVYATCDVNPQFNRVVFDKIGGTTNIFRGNVIVNYDSSMQINFPENPDYKISNYVVTRTDNIGDVSVTTNDISSENVASTNIVLNNIKGSNSVYATYEASPTYTITATAGSGLRATPSNCVVNAGSNTNILLEAIADGEFIKSIMKNGIEIYRNDGMNGMSSTNISLEDITNDITIAAQPGTNQYTVTAYSFGNGSVLPKTATVSHGGSKVFQMIADSYHKINNATKDGQAITEAAGQDYYNFELDDITDNHEVDASFDVKKTLKGTPYTWYANNGHPNPSNELDDIDDDNDRYNNFAEWNFGTNPTNSSSCLDFRINQNAGSGADISWGPSSTNSEYTLVSTDNLINGNWQTNYIGYGTDEQNQTITETNNAAAVKFYKLVGKRRSD